MKTNQEKLEAARAAIVDAETRDMSRTTLDKRYKAFFAVEDAIKAQSVWR